MARKYRFSPRKLLRNLLLLALTVYLFAMFGKNPESGQYGTAPSGEVNVIAVGSSESSDATNSGASNPSTPPLSQVDRIIDGDTVEMTVEGKKRSIRLIGIDTPESVDPRKPVECFSDQAKKRLEELISGKNIYLEKDDSQSDQDKYGRLLRYIFLEGGANVNEKMVREGYAHEYTYQAAYRYQREFKEAEKEARDNKRGLWADDACKEDSAAESAEPGPRTIPGQGPNPAKPTDQSKSVSTGASVVTPSPSPDGSADPSPAGLTGISPTESTPASPSALFQIEDPIEAGVN